MRSQLLSCLVTFLHLAEGINVTALGDGWAAGVGSQNYKVHSKRKLQYDASYADKIGQNLSIEEGDVYYNNAFAWATVEDVTQYQLSDGPSTINGDQQFGKLEPLSPSLEAYAGLKASFLASVDRT